MIEEILIYDWDKKIKKNFFINIFIEDNLEYDLRNKFLFEADKKVIKKYKK
jgi:hypothetical protein